MIFDLLNIDTREVLQAASTKWNFLNYTPGLVGGHCIGVDPYYLAHKAKLAGYEPEVILSGRKVNDKMGIHVANTFMKLLAKKSIPIKKALIVFGSVKKRYVVNAMDCKKKLRKFAMLV